MSSEEIQEALANECRVRVSDWSPEVIDWFSKCVEAGFRVIVWNPYDCSWKKTSDFFKNNLAYVLPFNMENAFRVDFGME